MKNHALFMAILIVLVHGAHFFGIVPSIGDRHIPLRISILVVAYSGWVIGTIVLYRHQKKK